MSDRGSIRAGERDSSRLDDTNRSQFQARRRREREEEDLQEERR